LTRIFLTLLVFVSLGYGLGSPGVASYLPTDMSLAFRQMNTDVSTAALRLHAQAYSARKSHNPADFRPTNLMVKVEQGFALAMR
jgi:hypothetical protein